MYINPITKSNQSTYAPGLLELTPEQEAMYLQYNSFVNITNTDPVEIEPDTEAWQAWKASLPDPLENLKTQRIVDSKTALAEYLETHPIQWTDGEYYSITQEKQNQLTSTLVSAQIDGESPEWNSTGLVCKQWNIEDLAALGVAIKNRVKKLVKYQQSKEIEINAAETLDELNSIVVDYDSVE